MIFLHSLMATLDWRSSWHSRKWLYYFVDLKQSKVSAFHLCITRD